MITASQHLWYWHRFRAMTPVEAVLHARKKVRQFSDMYILPTRSETVSPAWSGAYPRLPSSGTAPSILRDSLARDAERILDGRWRAFGQLELRVDDPPRWHADYLRGTDLATSAIAFQLDHRHLPDGGDIKVIWELSRWHQLVRLAMAAYVLDHREAATKCVQWLEHWVGQNPPYRGWNWTSPLEAAMRLIQFTWIHALLRHRRGASAVGDNGRLVTTLADLAEQIVPAHTRFTWRHRSFGSSANNHLIGELTGLILAAVAWPSVHRGSSLTQLQRQWEHEVLTQFNYDGGNREQALNYQLFSWELCWQARSALRAAGRSISREVEERLGRAACFYLDLQVPEDPWDYGDSDGAFVTPLFCDERTAVAEWHQWFAAPERSPAINFWWRGERVALEPAALHRRSQPPCPITYTQSGHAMWRGGGWAVRVNASPLGYLQTAAHGHCDALHISVWRDGIAMIVDPGTGSYFHDEKLREWLASRPAHNGPCTMDGDGPQRLGPFLWAHPYLPPSLEVESERVTARVCLGRHIAERTLCPLADGDGFEIHDRCWARPGDGPALSHRPFTVLWQFGPGAKLEAIDDRSYRVTRRGMSLRVDVNRNWSAVCAVDENDRGLQSPAATMVAAEPLAGTVSSSFRHIERAPYLKLTAQPEEGGASVFCTIFRMIPPA